jgi:hypothetical protein
LRQPFPMRLTLDLFLGLLLGLTWEGYVRLMK